jgi:hypothetical protein
MRAKRASKGAAQAVPSFNAQAFLEREAVGAQETRLHQYDGELPLKVNSSLLTVVLHD